ncbi:hypothetical protein Tco_0223321 [Tanacetum coccineum]
MSANDNFSLNDDEELSLHDDASLDGSVPASNKGDAPAKPPQIITTNTLSNIKLPVLQKDDYDTWAMEMEHYLEYIDNEVWKVIQNGNSKKRVTKGKDGVYRVLAPTTVNGCSKRSSQTLQRRKGKEPMTEEDLQAEVQASKTSKELQELADLEEAQRLQAKIDAETQRQIDLDALLARRLIKCRSDSCREAAQEALATEFDYIQARLNADQILAEKLQQEEREQYSIEERAKFLHDTIAAQRKFLAEQRSAIIRNKPPTISQLRNQMITYLKHVANKKHAELKSKSFEEIQVLYDRYKNQYQTFGHWI